MRPEYENDGGIYFDHHNIPEHKHTELSEDTINHYVLEMNSKV